MKILKNIRGFSLVQVMVGLGLTGVISYGVMTQLSNFNSMNSQFNTKTEMDLFLDNINKTILSKKVCDYNFGLKDSATLMLDTLYSNDAGKELVKVGEIYLNNAIRIESINLGYDPLKKTQFFVEITARKLKEKKSYNIVKRKMIIPADMSGSIINSCYFNMANAEDLDNICKGPGVHIVDGECFHKMPSFNDDPNPNPNTNLGKCNVGRYSQALKYLSNTILGFEYKYKLSCNGVFTSSTTCPSNRVKYISNMGGITCFDESEWINNNAPDVPFVVSSKYKLTVNSNDEIELALSNTNAGSCIPSACPNTASTTTCGEPILDANCSQQCDTGTKDCNTNLICPTYNLQYPNGKKSQGTHTVPSDSVNAIYQVYLSDRWCPDGSLILNGENNLTCSCESDSATNASWSCQLNDCPVASGGSGSSTLVCPAGQVEYGKTLPSATVGSSRSLKLTDGCDQGRKESVTCICEESNAGLDPSWECNPRTYSCSTNGSGVPTGN